MQDNFFRDETPQIKVFTKYNMNRKKPTPNHQEVKKMPGKTRARSKSCQKKRADKLQRTEFQKSVEHHFPNLEIT